MLGADPAGRSRCGTPSSAQGITTEITSPDTVVALDTTTEHVGRVAAGVGVVIYEMTAQHFDLEQYFLALTNPEGALR